MSVSGTEKDTADVALDRELRECKPPFERCVEINLVLVTGLASLATFQRNSATGPDMNDVLIDLQLF